MATIKTNVKRNFVHSRAKGATRNSPVIDDKIFYGESECSAVGGTAIRGMTGSVACYKNTQTGQLRPPYHNLMPNPVPGPTRPIDRQQQTVTWTTPVPISTPVFLDGRIAPKVSPLDKVNLESRAIKPVPVTPSRCIAECIKGKNFTAATVKECKNYCGT